jgi:hypothetical protein
MSKEQWFREFERLYNEAAEDGPVSDKVYESLAEKANRAFADRLADIADMERMRRKEEGK